MSSETRKPLPQRQRVVKFKSYGRPSSSLRPSPASTPPPFARSASDSNVATNQLLTGEKSTDKTSGEAIDKDSDAYLQHLIRKIFYPSVNYSNYQDILPTLTSATEVDIQLYALVALLFRTFVHSWYSRITNDQDFTMELVAIMAHITRTIEMKLKDVNLTTLLLDDIPFLLDEHMNDLRRVRKQLGSSFLPYDTIDKAFDHVNKHIALDDDPETEQMYYRILGGRLTRLLLPPEDRNSELVKTFVDSLLGDLLLRTITEKLSQPYQIFEIITLICQTLLKVDGKSDKENKHPPETDSIFSKISHLIAYSTSTLAKPKTRSNVKVYSLHIFTFLNNFLQIDKCRPTLYALIKSMSMILTNEKVNHMLNNILENTLLKTLKSPSLVATTIKAIRNNLFPTDGDMGPPRIEPDEAEFEAIRSTTKRSIIEVCEKFGAVNSLLISGSKDELDDVIEEFLTSFEGKRVNKHLVIRIVDLIVLRVLPELTTTE